MKLTSVTTAFAILGGAFARNDCSSDGSWGTLSANDAWANLRTHVENTGTHHVGAGTSYSWQVGDSQFCVRNRGSGTQDITNLQIAQTMLYNLQKCCDKKTWEMKTYMEVSYAGWAEYHVTGSWKVYVTLIPSSKDCNAY
ncbi:hypothetical protein ACJZ2D_016210 [Fusarium nematophilum]